MHVAFCLVNFQECERTTKSCKKNSSRVSGSDDGKPDRKVIGSDNGKLDRGVSDLDDGKPNLQRAQKALSTQSSNPEVSLLIFASVVTLM